MPTDSNPMQEFFERIGHRTYRTETAWWYEVWPRAVLSFPYHRLLEPDRSEIDRLIRDHRIKVVRYPTPLEAFGFPNTLEVQTDAAFDLGRLDREARRQTRQGLKQCTFERIGFDDLATHGLEMNRATAERQGRETIYCDADYWRRYCEAGKATEGVRAWGVMVEGKLGSYLVDIAFDGWSNWHLVHSLAELLPKRPNNVLFYEATRQFLAAGYKVCYGLGSLENTGSLDRFKVNMGVTVLAIKNRLILSGKARLAARLTPGPALALVARLFPKSYTVRKGVALLRQYRGQFSGEPPKKPAEDDPA